MEKNVIHARLSEIDVKTDLRNKIRKLKAGQSYDSFLRELVTIYEKKNANGSSHQRIKLTDSRKRKRFA